MKNTIQISLLILLCFLGSCKKWETEEAIVTHCTWFNESGVTIRFIPFYAGRPITPNEINMKDKDSFYLGNASSFANGKGPEYSTKYTTGMDSFHIIYDGKYLIAHVKYDSLAGPHAISFFNERHIGNPKNYHWWFVESTRQLYNEFTFTKEDYEYAKANGIEVE